MKIIISLVFGCMINLLNAQDLPCIIKRDTAPNEEGIIEKFHDQCTQSHLVALNSETSKQLFDSMSNETVQDTDANHKMFSLALPSVLNKSTLEISCKKVASDDECIADSYSCVLKTPIVNSGDLMEGGFGDYSPTIWTAKYQSQFFLRNNQYVYSPRQEFFMAEQTGAADMKKLFGKDYFNFKVNDKEGYPAVTLSCEDFQTFSSSGLLCHIIF